MAEIKLSIDRLQEGIYIKLPVKWGDHPFMFSSFKIRSQQQIDVIRHLGLKHVLVIPEKSDTSPLPPKEHLSDPVDEINDTESKRQSLWSQKQDRIEALKRYRRDLQKTENEFKQTMAQVRSLLGKIQNRPLNAIEDATQLIGSIADSLFNNKQVLLHLMSDGGSDENFYFHSLNVALLSMLLGRAAGLSEADIKTLGMAGLFHDIGKLKIPSQIMRKSTKLTAAEHKLMQMHPQYTQDFLNLANTVPEKIKIIAGQHHEYLDGSGYPKGLKGESIDRLSQLITVVNDYDSLCHPENLKLAKIPYIAMAYLFKYRKKQLNNDYLGLLIRLLGIYPPGSIVKLDNGQVGLVMSINSEKLLYPHVMVYDPAVPRSEAAIIDLLEEDLKIEGALKPSALPEKVFEYLNPRTRISYYFDHNK
jgi:HD-GYP domain-containing protein (c-di-GMP phosphodiesterase class II)